MALFFERLKKFAGLDDADITLVKRCLDELQPQWAHFSVPIVAVVHPGNA